MDTGAELHTGLCSTDTGAAVHAEMVGTRCCVPYRGGFEGYCAVYGAGFDSSGTGIARCYEQRGTVFEITRCGEHRRSESKDDWSS